MEYTLKRTTFPLNTFSTDRMVSGDCPEVLEVDMMLGEQVRRPSMPPRTILRAPHALGFPGAKPSPGAPRLLARPARHAQPDEAPTSSLALPLRPRRSVEDGIQHPLREAVCGPSLVLLALSALSQTAKSRAEETKLPLTVVSATPACVHVRLCCASQIASGALDLAIEIENCASNPIALSFGSVQSFDFSATRQGEVVPFWRWASGRRFAPQLRALRLDSGCALRFEAQWPDAPSGIWTIDGKVTANGGFEAQDVDVEIV